MKKDTIVRTIVLALALINQIFALVGIPQLNIDDDTIYQAGNADCYHRIKRLGMVEEQQLYTRCPSRR